MYLMSYRKFREYCSFKYVSQYGAVLCDILCDLKALNFDCKEKDCPIMKKCKKVTKMNVMQAGYGYLNVWVKEKK